MLIVLDVFFFWYEVIELAIYCCCVANEFLLMAIDVVLNIDICEAV